MPQKPPDQRQQGLSEKRRTELIADIAALYASPEYQAAREAHQNQQYELDDIAPQEFHNPTSGKRRYPTKPKKNQTQRLTEADRAKIAQDIAETFASKAYQEANQRFKAKLRTKKEASTQNHPTQQPEKPTTNPEPERTQPPETRTPTASNPAKEAEQERQNPFSYTNERKKVLKAVSKRLAGFHSNFFRSLT